MIEVAGAIIYRGKGYLHVEAKIKGNGYLAVEPVFTAELTTESLTAALERVIAAGHPIIQAPSRLEMKLRADPILRASGAKNWEQLAVEGASYTISWYGNQTTLYMSRLDKKGRFEVDATKTRSFPLNAPLPKLVETILADARTRPNLGKFD